MKIVQALVTLSFGDAVSNDALAMHQSFQEMGFSSEIYAENIDSRIRRTAVYPIAQLRQELHSEDVLFYHLSTGTEWNYRIAEMPGRKVIVYHNVTPPEFYRGYSYQVQERCEAGLEGARFLADQAEACLAVSAFNRDNLREMGYRCPIEVIPILIPFADYEKKPDKKTIHRFKDGRANILFTGRLAPNKRQEDVIQIFAYYKKYFHSHSRLLLVGSSLGMEGYLERLQAYVRSLHLEDDIIFTGHISFEQLLAYYHSADAFLCMSEHEGFCVPLVEAMYFQIPIIAYQSSAIGDTLGGSGILVENKNMLDIAGILDRTVRDRQLREKVIAGQTMRLQAFQYDRIKAQLQAFLERLMRGDFL